MMYDGYYLYLPRDERDMLDKVLPQFKKTYSELRHSTAGLVKDMAKWDKFFTLVFTEVSDSLRTYIRTTSQCS